MPLFGLNPSQVLFKLALVVVFLATGTANTLFAKWTDLLYANGTNPTVSHLFYHPFFQTNLMFLGEMFCLFAFEAILCFIKYSDNLFPEERQESARSTPIVWLIPAMCDLVSSSLIYIGLQLTSAASFQMIHGSVILFTGFLSVLFLKTKLYIRHWIGMLTIVTGLVIVGCGDYVWHRSHTSNHGKKWHAVIGDAFIIVSQLLSAIQSVVEEKFLKKFNVDPLKVVGWEGLFGFVMMFLAFMPMYYIPWHFTLNYNENNSSSEQVEARFEDAIDAFSMMFNNKFILISSIGVVVSIAIYNFTALTVIKKWNATTFIVLDSTRTMFVWGMTLILPGWQIFQPFQPAGYFLLVVGTFIYYNILFMPVYHWIKRKCNRRNHVHIEEEEGERDSLLGQSYNENQVQADDSATVVNDDDHDNEHTLFVHANRI